MSASTMLLSSFNNFTYLFADLIEGKSEDSTKENTDQAEKKSTKVKGTYL